MSLPLSDAGEITSGPFIMKGTDVLPLLRIAFAIFQNSQDVSFYFLLWFGLPADSYSLHFIGPSCTDYTVLNG